MTVLLDVLSWACIVAGGAFCLLAGLGVVRLPDAFTRMHAASLGDTLGAGLILLGLLLQVGFSHDTVGIKLILIMVFLLFTSPVSTHALAHAALLDALKPWTRSGRDTTGHLAPETPDEDAFLADPPDEPQAAAGASTTGQGAGQEAGPPNAYKRGETAGTNPAAPETR